MRRGACSTPLPPPLSAVTKGVEDLRWNGWSPVPPPGPAPGGAGLGAALLLSACLPHRQLCSWAGLNRALTAPSPGRTPSERLYLKQRFWEWAGGVWHWLGSYLVGPRGRRMPSAPSTRLRMT